jgi:CRP-like cAMP-binding protein
LLKRKKFTMDQIREMAPKNAITRAVGVYESCEPETLVLDAVAGDRYLLCSDGLSGYFEEPHGTSEELALLLGREDADALATELINTANARGGKDNITAVVISIGAVAGEHAVAAQRVELKKKVLSEMRLFRALDERELLRVLEGTEEARFDPGSRIISQGDDGDALFIVLTGEVDVLVSETVVRTLKSGEHFGEMALIRSQPRSASVVSRGVSELLLIRRSEFFEIMRSQPRIAVKLLWEFTGVLAERLAETTKSLGSARVELAEELSPDEFQEEVSQTGVHAIDDDDDRQTIRIPPPPASVPPEDGADDAAAAEQQDDS